MLVAAFIATSPPESRAWSMGMSLQRDLAVILPAASKA
jgi:hypothetical protein